MSRARAAALAAVVVSASGCAQILGLDPTEQRDASGPGVCDVDLDCAGAPDRAVCGRLVDAVTRGPYTVAAATGAACGGSTSGPCAFSITGMTTDRLFTGVGDEPIAASVVDDCGRFRVEGLTGDKLAVMTKPLDEALLRQVGRTILYNDSGPIGDLEIPVVPNALVSAWEGPAGVTIPEGLLLFFRNGATPIDDAVAKVETVVVGPPPTLPYALYFAGPARFMDVTSDGVALATSTGPTGTALLVPANTMPFLLGGSQPGTNCTAVGGVQLVLGALIYIDLTNC